MRNWQHKQALITPLKKEGNPGNKRILFISHSTSSFIRQDIDELSKEYRVEFKHYDLSKKLLTPLFMMRNSLFVLFNAQKFDAIVVSFGTYLAYSTSIAAKLRRRKPHIVLHGTDCAAIHCINYGLLRGKLQRYFLGKAYKNAHLLPVSDSLVSTRNLWIPDANEQNQGLAAFFPADKFQITSIPNGFDVDFWGPDGDKIPNSFLSVFGAGQFVLKGGDLMIELARLRPEITINIVGFTLAETGLTELPPNIHFLGRMPQEDLKKWYQQSEFYLQLSMYDGFGCSLCEAMLCNVIPITSSSNILPEIVQGSGISVERRTIEELVTAVDELIQLPEAIRLQRSKNARKHVVDNYPIERRINELKRAFGFVSEK